MDCKYNLIKFGFFYLEGRIDVWGGMSRIFLSVRSFIEFYTIINCLIEILIKLEGINLLVFVYLVILVWVKILIVVSFIFF